MTPETRPPPLLPPKLISNDEDYERLERVLHDLMNEDQWINDFIKRLNYTVENMVRRK